MRIVYSDQHKLRDAKAELEGAGVVAPFERPARMDALLAALDAGGYPAPEAPTAHDLAPILAIHDADYVRFLETIWDDWRAAGRDGEAAPNIWPSRRAARKPDLARASVDARLGWYALACETSISPGTWEAARAAADVALSAAAIVASGAGPALALCRPPGHHAASDMYGGYCFLNNAAIAAEALRRAGAARVAVLDVDFHHGNGTQEIFYDREDVLFLSIHGDPDQAFPFYLGGADERGRGAGEGFTVNYPLAPGAGSDAWAGALEDALGRIAAFKADALVLSLGLDAVKDDPLSFFTIDRDDYARMSARVAALGAPTAIMLEGGYDLGGIGAVLTASLSEFQ